MIKILNRFRKRLQKFTNLSSSQPNHSHYRYFKTLNLENTFISCSLFHPKKMSLYWVQLMVRFIVGRY